MLRRAGRRRDQMGNPPIGFIQMDAAHPCRMATPIDLIICTYSLTSMHKWKSAFKNSWNWLKPGGTYLIHDIDGQRRNLHTRAVELATHSHFGDKVWEPLQHMCIDFRMDYIEPSAPSFWRKAFRRDGHEADPLTRPCPFSSTKTASSSGPSALRRRRASYVPAAFRPPTGPGRTARPIGFCSRTSPVSPSRPSPRRPPPRPSPLPPVPGPPRLQVRCPAEQEIWSGHPSQILNLGIYIFWGAILLLTIGAVCYLSDSTFWTLIIIGIMALIAGINAGIAYFHLKTLHYTVSTQRVRIVSGIFSKEIQEIELFRVKGHLRQPILFPPPVRARHHHDPERRRKAAAPLSLRRARRDRAARAHPHRGHEPAPTFRCARSRCDVETPATCVSPTHG